MSMETSSKVRPLSSSARIRTKEQAGQRRTTIAMITKEISRLPDGLVIRRDIGCPTSLPLRRERRCGARRLLRLVGRQASCDVPLQPVPELEPSGLDRLGQMPSRVDHHESEEFAARTAADARTRSGESASVAILSLTLWSAHEAPNVLHSAIWTGHLTVQRLWPSAARRCGASAAWPCWAASYLRKTARSAKESGQVVVQARSLPRRSGRHPRTTRNASAARASWLTA